jgi:hypothetical protein
VKKIKNIVSAILFQIKQLEFNLFIFKKNSHCMFDGTPRFEYNTEEYADQICKYLNKKMKKNNRNFTYYKCVYCDGFHVKPTLKK